MSDPPRRSKRAVKPPVPLYIPDPNIRFDDDFVASGEEDLSGEEDYSSDELNTDSDEDYDSSEENADVTAQGYERDGFVVDDDDAMSIDSDYYESEEEYITSDDEQYSSSGSDTELCDHDDNESITQEEIAQG